MNVGLWFDLAFRRRVREQIKALGPWYQQQMLLPGVWTRPWNQATIGELIHAERGAPKFRRFILPLIKPYLKGATVLELGCNAAHNLVLALRAGAAEVWGVEPEERYRRQATLARQCLGLQGRITVSDRIPLGDRDKRTFDIGLLCAVLRHIPESERTASLECMGQLCHRVLIQGSGLKDAPDGDSVESILGYIRQTTLQVEDLRSEPHVRGLRILLRSP